ncbi:putative disease resistance RPP13-like protein 3 [Daucus carota subsp. sativus]|uniref:putative disease resistance RPP13-like protein 3 n=1 Tax=Daucus carota subsp. sativus TaxID=79200 RepID=UPI0007EF510E|nr:PREDICTED: putative disease resistance RPP13-like protein 3 [Daucus carota subsp. sativus]
MVDAAVSFTIEKLHEFVSQQVNIRIGVKDGIGWLKDELGYLLISVRAAEAHQDKDHIRRWTDSVKDVANQAVIILERFSAQREEQAADEQGGVLDCIRRFICICKKEANLYDLGKDIESLKQKMIGIKSRRDEYHINDMIIATPNVQKRRRKLLRAASFDHEKDVVGFGDDVRTLLAKLGNEDPSLGLISIHGMGGLGKSTLASKLYHSSELSHFKSRAWVCVSEDYDITHVLRKIIKCFEVDGQDSLNKMEEVELLRHLRKILLQGDHYLVVIDDIWDVEVWKKIKNAFPDKKNGSRIIITTRNKVVAEGVEDTCFVYELSFLSKDESWQLFCKRAKPTPNLEMLGKEMLDKCGGLPLAIVILSGLLLQKRTYKFWSDVKDQLWRKLKGESSEIQELLNLSYDDLSFNMRQCFLYLARYPEDHTIRVFKLKLLWIAEEFVEEHDEVDMEDVAEDYVNELINRNMIQIELQTADGQVLACKIHDLVRDLVIEKAREQKILGIFDSNKHHPNPIRSLQGQTRHAIYNGIGEYFKLLGPNSGNLNLRSLALTTKTARLQVEEIKLMYTRFQYLKVLDLTSVNKSVGIPEEIGDLVLLKFLGLMGGPYSGKALVIPPSIGKLKRLQTLHGSVYMHNSYVFPKEICELKELRHIFFNEIEGNLNIGSDQTKLQTISEIMYKEWCHIETNNWTNLHTLVISEEYGDDEEEEEEYSLESMANLTSLRTLVLLLGMGVGGVISTMQPLSSCKHLNKLVLLCKIKDLAELNFLPDSITDLTLSVTTSTEDPMPIPGSLSNLTSLWLMNCGDKMVCSADVFPCLQFLRIQPDSGGPFELQVDDGALPSLRAFTLERLPFLRVFLLNADRDMIPLRLKSLPSVPDFQEYLF